MFKNCKLVGEELIPGKKRTNKQKEALAKILKKKSIRIDKKTQIRTFQNRFALNLQKQRVLKFFYHSRGNISTLEKKLYVALYRLNFASSIRNARQMILEGKVWVNNRVMKSPQYDLKPSDCFGLIQVESQIARIDQMKEAENQCRNYLSFKNPSFEVNYSNFTAIYLFPSQFISTPFRWFTKLQTKLKI